MMGFGVRIDEVRKKSNYSFKMTATPDDKEVLKYTADEVVCIDYTEKTENNPLTSSL